MGFIFEDVPSRLIIAELTDDYLDTTVEYIIHFENGYPPYVREAPAPFMRNDEIRFLDLYSEWQP